MKLKVTIALVFTLMVYRPAHAQVWYPEGVFIHNEPVMIKVNNQVITISRTGSDALGSFWRVCTYDGKTWNRLPLLVLNKTAEISDIEQYQGAIYISGNFTFDNASSNAVVRFNPLTGKWQGIAIFQKASSFASVSSMDVQNTQLVLGGSFVNIVTGAKSDTISNLARYNGIVNRFGHYFEASCKGCDPNGAVNDIISNDTISAISGQFTQIGGKKSLYLARIYKNTVLDTFASTPQVMEKLALDGNIIYATSGALKNKHIYEVRNTFTDINYNLDSALSISEILVHDGRLLASGAFSLSSANSSFSIVRLEGNKWVDISNNYGNVHYIAAGRSALFAVGSPSRPISVWNPNRFVVRFYPGLSLVRTKVFLDSNNNCIWEKGERPVAKQFVRLPFLNRGAFTNEEGMTEFLVPNAIQNTLKFVIKPLRNHIRSNCADTTVTKTFSPGIYLDSIQFPVVRIPNINDIRITVSSPKGAQVIRNKRVFYYITCENVGSNTVDGKISLSKHEKFSNQKAEPAGKEVNASTYEWSYTKLLPGEKRLFAYSALADDTSFSNQMEFNAAASSMITGGSQNTDDDSDSIPQLVSGSSSAFRKEVYPTPLPGDSITYLSVNERDLRYHISFSNFSDDTVFYAVVIDTLDLNLDMSYIQETGSNKHYYTELQTDPNNQYKGILIWHFPNIGLAPNPSMNFEVLESGSYIGFKVVTKPLSNGYMLKNVASVYYDNEYAGITNPVYCSVAISGIEELGGGDDHLLVYPNPFTHELNVAHAFRPGDLVRVYSSNGQLVYEEQLEVEAAGHTIEMGHIAPGMYMIQLISGSNILYRTCIRQ